MENKEPDYNMIHIYGVEIFGQMYIEVHIEKQRHEQILMMCRGVEKEDLKGIERLMQNRRTPSFSLTSLEVELLGRLYLMAKGTIEDFVQVDFTKEFSIALHVV